MTDPIRDLIAAARDYSEGPPPEHPGDRASWEKLRAALAAAEARPEPKPDPALRDWPEDFAGENGNYTNTCAMCGLRFVGHKRRVTCKVCAQKARPEPAAEPADWTARLAALGVTRTEHPAAEPSEFDALIAMAKDRSKNGWPNAAILATINAVEALAREVRR